MTRDRTPQQKRAVDDAVMSGSSDARTAIVSIAAEMIAAHGFSKVSIRDIARRAGVSVSTVMYHAGSKKELLEHCLEATFSADTRLVDLIAYLGSVRAASSEEFFALYDQFIEALVRHVAAFPMGCRLWWRLLLDHEALFHGLEGKYHRQLFVNCNRFLKDAQDRRLIRDDLVDLSFFLSSLDSILDGFFVVGLILTDGTRTRPGAVERLSDFEKWLKQFGRLVLSRP